MVLLTLLTAALTITNMGKFINEYKLLSAYSWHQLRPLTNPLSLVDIHKVLFLYKNVSDIKSYQISLFAIFLASSNSKEIG